MRPTPAIWFTPLDGPKFARERGPHTDFEDALWTRQRMTERGPSIERLAEPYEGAHRLQLGRFSLQRDPTGDGWNLGREDEVLLAGLTDEQAFALVVRFLERQHESGA